MSEAPIPAGAPAINEEDFRDLFDKAPCGYLSATPAGVITHANETLAHWLGLPKAELVGRRFQDLLSVAGKIYYETHFAPLVRMQGFLNEVALDLVGSDGSVVPVLANAVERRDAVGAAECLRITLFNASDRRRYEAELLRARRQAEMASAEVEELNRTLEARVAEAVARRIEAEEALRQSQKMEAIGQLTGGVAHDFNNLLTVILGGLDMVAHQAEALPAGPVAERLRRASAMAAHAAERAAALTARLLAFSRQQALDPRPLDVSQLVTGLADLLQRTLGETVALATVSGGGLWRTLADPAELENALLNLAVNARDAMPGGGRLSIETSNAFLDEDYVATLVEPVPAGEYVLIRISDTGVGMDADTLERAFEPFFTTKEVGKGTGLGLSQVYGFVRQSGGHVKVWSEVGHGTTVDIYLPRVDAAVDAAPEPKTPAAVGAAGAGERILLVEDDEDVRRYASEVLMEGGYNLATAVSGPEALQMLRDGLPVDLLFADVVLPDGMDGRQLARQALALRPGLKVLFTTGYARNAIVHNGQLDAEAELLSKPYNSKALCEKVRALLDA